MHEVNALIYFMYAAVKQVAVALVCQPLATISVQHYITQYHLPLLPLYHISYTVYH